MTFFKHHFRFLLIIVLVSLTYNCISQNNKDKFITAQSTIVTKDTLKPDSIIKINYDQMIDSIICFAEKHLGIRYKAGGKTKSGFDCSGFIYYVFGKYGINLPNGARNQALKGMPLDVKDIKKGDLVFFKGRNSRDPLVGHVGLVVEKNDSAIRFIHASTRKGVTFDFTYSDYYRIRFIGAKRLLGENIIDSLWENFKMPAPDKEDSLELVQTDSIESADKIENHQSSQNYISATYSVKKGETLFAIAKKHNTTVEKIKEFNNLKNDKIRPGQILIVKTKQAQSKSTISPVLVDKKTPDLNIKKDSIINSEKIVTNQPLQKSNSKNHVVSKGETLNSIAKMNNTTADRIMELNNLKSDKIRPGQKLILNIEDSISIISKLPGLNINNTPDINIKKDSIAKPEKKENNQSSQKNYIVRKGDNLYAIAKKNNTTADKIIELNKLKSDKIQPGQKLILK